jgi:hypothetical protein
LQKNTRSILDELDSFASNRRDRSALIESRAVHVIQGAINLINYIRENFDENTAGDLERRLLNSIRAQDSSKFIRGIKRTKSENQ